MFPFLVASVALSAIGMAAVVLNLVHALVTRRSSALLLRIEVGSMGINALVFAIALVVAGYTHAFLLIALVMAIPLVATALALLIAARALRVGGAPPPRA